MITTTDDLKARFKNNLRPDQQDFADLVDTLEQDPTQSGVWINQAAQPFAVGDVLYCQGAGAGGVPVFALANVWDSQACVVAGVVTKAETDRFFLATGGTVTFQDVRVILEPFGDDLATGPSWPSSSALTAIGWDNSGASTGPFAHTGASANALACSAVLAVSGTHRVRYNVSGMTHGQVQLQVGTSVQITSANGSYLLDTAMITGSGSSMTFTPSSDFDGTIDSISLRPVIIYPGITFTAGTTYFLSPITPGSVTPNPIVQDSTYSAPVLLAIGNNSAIVALKSPTLVLNPSAAVPGAPNYNPILSAIGRSVALYAPGQVLIGGDFSTVSGKTQGRLCKYLTGDSPAPDTTFMPTNTGFYHSLAAQIAAGLPVIPQTCEVLNACTIGSGSSAITAVGGRFTNFGSAGQGASKMMLLNSSGAPVTNVNMNLNNPQDINVSGYVNSICANKTQTKFWGVGSGWFAFPGDGTNTNNYASVTLVSTASVKDGTFHVAGRTGGAAGFTGSAFRVTPADTITPLATAVGLPATDPCQDVYIGGSFTAYKAIVVSTSTNYPTPGRILRISETGVFRRALVTPPVAPAGTAATIYAICPISTDSTHSTIFIGGNFTSLNGSQTGVAKLTDDGTNIVATTWTMAAKLTSFTQVRNIILLTGGASGLATAGVQLTAGCLLVVGTFNHAGNTNVTMIDQSGAKVTGFVGMANATVYDAVELQDGSIVLAGSFTTYNGYSTHKYSVRVNPDGSIA